MKIHLVYSSLPPVLDGIGDYTVRQAAVLAKYCDVKILTAQPDFELVPGVKVAYAFRGGGRAVDDLLHTIRVDQPDWLILQYNPACYSGRFGFNPYLPRLLRDVRRECPETKIALMIHEAFASPDRMRHLGMALWQRLQLWLMGRHAHLMLCSIESWVQQISAWFPDKPVRHLPVGSNMPRVESPREALRQQLNIGEETLVLGVFGSVSHARLWHLTQAAAQALYQQRQDMVVLYIGPHGAAMRVILGSLPFIDLGPLPALDVSQHLGIIDIYLASFRHGVSTRRGSLMAGLQHGLPIVTTKGSHTGDFLLEQNGKTLLLASTDDARQFTQHVLTLANDAALRTRMGQAAEMLYLSSFDWDVMVSRLLAWLNEERPIQSEVQQA